MSDAVTLDRIRNSLEGVAPAAIATCDADGTPNVSLLSQVHYVDGEHVALSYQFFNKTRRNLLANPVATLQLVDPETAAQHRLTVRYLRTETDGPLFESMKAKLSGIASHVGMQGVFRLLGADVCRVVSVERVPGASLPAEPRGHGLLSATRRCCERLAADADQAELFDRLLDGLRSGFGVEHAQILMLDEPADRLYAVATMGYRESGVGAEVALGEGVIGVAARERVPIRITHVTAEYGYGRAVRDRIADAAAIITEIPFPGLPEPYSQLAVPITAGPRLFGVLFVESRREFRFRYDDEDALATVAAQLAARLAALVPAAEAEETAPAGAAVEAGQGVPATVRHYAADDSVFIDHDYLIKGVAGAIFWKLARDHVEQGRTDFTNRELRLAADIRLPDAAENLEARLILLQRRLAERCRFLRIEKTGRGRFRLAVDRPLSLEAMP
ncbi:GAF domain-containing protein [Azospirillum sp. RWY-5-1]|uniref:GAF domain-containing protein n=1 Tax=Azospirillum oleiclasticum TaxID=2735135 RepID=A0ABX2T6T4_9PROT|nr:GAF domain-containing protein [Azospirillum oleiclasticum]NYZ12846.1 GAF domain-containing protein [Azospirillum oleiclasticum]NYZ20006.1 GAF domain-containing protein [Azospirillum oleiclasticum]